MLGQSDLNPEATASAPDSYLAKPIWKRMVVISGGVVMNIVLALAIFMLVFFVGLRTEPPKIGVAYPEGPAAAAVATNAESLGVTDQGLKPGDLVLEVNGKRPNEFNDIVMAAAMAGPGERVRLLVERPGTPDPLRFEILPERSQFSNMLEIGVEPARSLTIPPEYGADPEQWASLVERLGLVGVEPGMRLASIAGETDLHSAGTSSRRRAARPASPSTSALSRRTGRAPG